MRPLRYFDRLVLPVVAAHLDPFLEMDMDGYQASFDKLWGYANVVRFGAKHLTRPHGSYCTGQWRTCPQNQISGQVALGSVGGAVEALVRAIAPEIAPRRINVVSPGTIDTPMVTLSGEERAAQYKKLTQRNILPRAGTPKEVAQAIVFQVQNEFVTGTTIDVDGGWLLS